MGAGVSGSLVRSLVGESERTERCLRGETLYPNADELVWSGDYQSAELIRSRCCCCSELNNAAEAAEITCAFWAEHAQRESIVRALSGTFFEFEKNLQNLKFFCFIPLS